MFFNPSLIMMDGIEPFLHDSLNTIAERADLFVVDSLRNSLFGNEDLVLRNIFRARDDGLPTYSELCACYGTIPYGNTEDPYEGVLGEPLVEGSSLPRTAAVIVAEQFKRLRIESDDGPFGPSIAAEIRRTTLKTVIEQNTDLRGVRSFYSSS